MDALNSIFVYRVSMSKMAGALTVSQLRFAPAGVIIMDAAHFPLVTFLRINVYNGRGDFDG
jgi:hypothetical protein